MAGRLEQHGSEQFDDLFDEDTGEPGSLAEIVDKHAGDAVFLGRQNDGGATGADAGLADFAGEMGQSDPPDFEEGSEDDRLSLDAASGVGITGTTEGVARGFGSHVPLDLGAGGFQFEEIPAQALGNLNRPLPNEELDDYDDDDPNNGKYDPKDLENLSIPGNRTHDFDTGVEEQ